jgi:hypothetical protein
MTLTAFARTCGIEEFSGGCARKFDALPFSTIDIHITVTKILVPDIILSIRIRVGRSREADPDSRT